MSRAAGPAVLLLAAAVAAADAVDDALWRARRLQLVDGDLGGAARLYERALPSLDGARAAEVRLRLAECLAERDPDAARRHLRADVFDDPAVPGGLRRAAAAMRDRLRVETPPLVGPPPADAERIAAEREQRIAAHLDEARRLMRAREEARAFFHVARALAIDPEHEPARRLEADLSRRLGGLTRFVRDQLELLRGWEEARVVLVSRRVSALLGDALQHVRQGRHGLADGRFREALDAIDGSEFAEDSETLATLRRRVADHWRSARARRGRPAPPTEPLPRTVGSRANVRDNLLESLQQMLDRLGDDEDEERILPVVLPGGGAASRGWLSKPDAWQLVRDHPSSHGAAEFARRWIPLRVEPESWREPGHFVDEAGGMLLARNRPVVLDAVASALARWNDPVPGTLRARFLLARVPGHARDRLERLAGDASHAGAGEAPWALLPPGTTPERVASLLRDDGVDIDAARDLFVLDLDNGRPQTLTLLRAAPGNAPPDEAAPRRAFLRLDLFPLRAPDGRTALSLRATGRAAARDGRPPVGWEGELFADLGPGRVVALGPLPDPFVPAADDEESLFVFWENPGLGAAAVPPGTAPDRTSPRRVEIPLDALLLHDQVRDRPGPRRDPERGFAPVDPLTVLRERADFLVELLRQDLGTDELAVDLERAVLRVPPALRDPAAELVAALERESRRAYVVRIEARAVRTAVLERWMEREELAVRPFGDAWLAMSDEPQGASVLRALEPAEPADLFAPRALPAITVLGLQARHARSLRERTSPAWRDERDLATADARTITEGLRVTVRPFRWRGVLYAEVTVETAALDSETEEWSLPGAVPVYRTRLSGTTAQGMIEFGNAGRPRTALVCRVPHPTASRPGHITELVLAVSIRATP